MAMGHDGKIQLRQIDSLGGDVMREDLCVVAGIEQDARVAVFDEGRKAPVLLHAGGLAEGVVKDRDLRRVYLRARRWRTDCPESHRSQSAQEQATRQRR